MIASLLTYVAHYVIARTLYDAIGHPMWLLAAALLLLLFANLRRRRRNVSDGIRGRRS